MLGKIKHIFAHGAIYGVAQLAGKILNFLLIPFFTFIMEKSQMGVYTDLYTWVAFLIIVLTFGSETAFFKFAQEIPTNEPERARKQDQVLSTAAVGVLGLSVLFAGLVVVGLKPIAALIRYEDTPEIILMVLGILMLDVWSALPKAQLRRQGRARFFVMVNLTAIIINIAVNLLLLLAVPQALAQGWLTPEQLPWFSPEHIVHHVFAANLCASLGAFLMVVPTYLRIQWQFDGALLRRMVAFGVPLMLAGLAGMFNERADIQMIKYLSPEETALEEVGIYGTVYKFAMLILILNQAFRYAAEPIVFKHFKRADDDDPASAEAKQGLALTTDWFIVVLSLGLVCTLAAKVIIEAMVAAPFEEGLYILPILLLSNVFYAIHTQLSFWYKLINKTVYGLWITAAGAVVTLVLTMLLIPRLGYAGAAWATLGSYTTMMVLSYALGQRHYPCPYNIRQSFVVVGMSMGLGLIAWFFATPWLWVQVLCVLAYAGFLAVYLGPTLRELRQAS